MKIISIPINTPKIINYNCGAVLEVDPKDIIRKDSDREGFYYVFKCAHCNHNIFIDTKSFNWKV